MRIRQDRDPAAREQLVRQFLPLARHLAHRYPGADDPDDLEQVAAVGLLKAIDRFDPERGPAFTTFAFPTILGELKRHFRDRGWSVRVPRAVQELAVRLEHLSGELAGELGRAPTVAELADRAHTTSEQVLEALQAANARHALPLDRPREDDDGTEATGRDVAVEDPGFATVEDAAMLEDLMRILPERDRLILMLRWREDRLQWQIAEIVGVSQMDVSRVIRDSIERLRYAARSQVHIS